MKNFEILRIDNVWLGKQDEKTEKMMSYFDLLTSYYRWPTFYAMNWISQISFFHHYINNRVLMITGATGQGKSTQIPKLYLYALYMIDKNYNGKIICSVPRTVPAMENSEQISYEFVDNALVSIS